MYLYKSKLYFICFLFCLSLCPRRVRLQRRKELLDIYNPDLMKRARVPAHLKRNTKPKPIAQSPPILRFKPVDNDPTVKDDATFSTTPFLKKLTESEEETTKQSVGTLNPNTQKLGEAHEEDMYVSDHSVEANSELFNQSDILTNTNNTFHSNEAPPTEEDYSADNDGLKSIEYYLHNPIKEPGFNLLPEEIKRFKIWSLGKVPYYMDKFSFGKVMRDRIRAFLLEASSLTGLKFWELPSPPEDLSYRWVLFINRRRLLNCEDFTIKDFNDTGVQDVVLGYNCINDHGKMAGLVLALAGVPPMHTSPDRNTYSAVNWNEIMPEKSSLFAKIPNTEWIFHDLPYDYGSAGHYNFFKYTKSGKATIRPLKPTEIDVGYVTGFSPYDVLKIRMLYNYIGQQRKVELDKKTCKELFNCDKFRKVPRTNSDTKPRPKPDQYLDGNQ